MDQVNSQSSLLMLQQLSTQALKQSLDAAELVAGLVATSAPVSPEGVGTNIDLKA